MARSLCVLFLVVTAACPSPADGEGPEGGTVGAIGAPLKLFPVNP